MMGDTVAIGDLACITSCVRGRGGGECSGVCMKERERESWEG